MDNVELLKTARNTLLSLHKILVDHERSIYEGIHGPTTGSEFLGLLLTDPGLSWLRKFSALIVDIDEMFAQKDGFDNSAVEAHLQKIRELADNSGIEDQDFAARYRTALQQNADAAAKQGELKALFT